METTILIFKNVRSMKNCLVTTLKAAANNENLQELGMAVATIVISAPDCWVGVICGNLNGGGKIKLIEGDSASFSIEKTDDYMQKNGDVVTVVNNGQSAYDSLDTGSHQRNLLRFSTAGTYKLLYDKYNISLVPKPNNSDKVPRVGLNLDEMDYLQSPSYIKTAGEWTSSCYKGSIDVLAEKLLSSTTALFVSGIGSSSSPLFGFSMYGNIEELVNCPNLNVIKLSLQTTLEGNLKTLVDNHPNRLNFLKIFLDNTTNVKGGSLTAILGGLTKLTEFNGENNSNFNGSTTEIAEAQVAAGRTSGTLKISGYMRNFTPSGASSERTIKFGTSMVNPTEEETAQGYQIV